jgi:hypothetical protein
MGLVTRVGSWQWRGARGGLQGLHARDRRYDGAHQGQQHRRQGRRQLGKLARGEAGTQPHRSSPLSQSV